ncbi:alanyl-tRNA editing protein [Emticicia sp. CRIBPO]|uniref:alanyl-tRNA editing protein n=1 Tax=Emticicia sp. CRIBPO TaxID=2683258 RepID=UPI00141353FD|nr:alanyl-tRNA editing protein [Emticicia sp. CRIBPO]NBA84718.1 alanyl-tRNA editing protein [Emticicia sp. CRIBPO]
MPVKKLFWDNPYLTELSTIITGVSGDTVTLESTIAYAFSGGQQSDEGTLNGLKIIKAEKHDKEIFYTLEPDHGLETGQGVLIQIDWDKRYRIMKLHFAAEIILELVYQNFGRPEKTGANITFDKARIDFVRDKNISEMFPLLNEKARELIALDLPVESAFSDEAAQRRYWRIEGFGQVACGGTHIRRTGEIGPLKLKRVNLGQNRERIEIYLTE